MTQDIFERIKQFVIGKNDNDTRKTLTLGDLERAILAKKLDEELLDLQ